ncbi:MAG: hypothetical protein LBP67_09935 [Bacteroidales bacterium]|jgi:hypothetical protein|nr:hypothetical protein [Bacteroidales bacterium]
MKHKVAIYYDKEGDRKCFRADELNKDKATIVELKKYDLFDSTEEFKLTTVDLSHTDKRTHFRLLNPTHEMKFYMSDDSDKHDEKISELMSVLNGEYQKIKFVYKDFSTYPAEEKELVAISQYVFQDEVARETEVDKPYARFDIFGMDKTLSTSRKRPEIIIEVVDKCFHNADLFNFLVDKTKKTSLIVLYYFILEENRYNTIKKTGNSVDFRISCYIKNGVFFYCGIPVEVPNHYLQEEIDNIYRDFNFVEQNIIKFIKRKEKIDIAALKRNVRNKS